MNNSTITNKVLYWYDNNKRSLPWRKKNSQIKREYYTLVSEFMSQQTQVSTVIPYFKKFIKNIPNLKSLANINEKKLLKYWEGLGYYSRARNLKKTSQVIIKNFKGKVPGNFEDLENLHGVGHKTASVVVSQGFGYPAFPVDTHIHRLAQRWGLTNGRNVVQTEEDLKSLFPKKSISSFSCPFL